MDLPKQKGKEQTEHPEERQGASRRGVFIPELRATLRRLEKNVDTRAHARTERQIEIAANDEKEMRELLSQIAVVAFVGPSGTGKSTRAIRVAKQNSIRFIIDDGLLINGSRIVAGNSAKKAPTKLESVRQALFEDPSRSSIMRRALAENLPSTLMILGTSDAMLEKICTNLWLNQPAMLIRIEDAESSAQKMG